MPSFRPTQLTTAQLETKDREFQDVVRAGVETERVWSELHVYFSRSPLPEDQVYRYSYFRWYTSLTWVLMYTSTPIDVVATMAFGRQVPTALLLGIDVWESLMYFLVTRTKDAAEMAGVYNQIRVAFFASRAVVGMWKGQEITVADVVREVQRIDSHGNNSIEQAAFDTKIRELFFPKDTPEISKWFAAEPNQVVDWFVGLVNFFLGVVPEKIQVIAKQFLDEQEKIEMQNSLI